jgi:hypothetical protein
VNPLQDIALGLDASSTVIGYGAMTYARRLLDAGLITPSHRGDGSWDRIVTMGDDLAKLLDTLHPKAILVEWTKGKVGQRHGGLGAGLAVYGCGVGAAAAIALQWSRQHPPCELAAILENDWTRGVPKRARQLAIAAAYPEYGCRLAEDPGGDIADGIGLADWWLREKQVEQCLFEPRELGV